MTSIKGWNFQHNGPMQPCSSIICQKYRRFIEVVKYSPSDFISTIGGHGGRVVTLSPPTSAARVRSPSWPVGKLVVACRWSAVYSTEP